MAGYLRGPIDARFTSHHRPVVRGAMLCRGVLYRKTTLTPEVQHAGWKPDDADPTLRAPHESAENEAIYIGPARVQPQLGWRARKQNRRDAVVTEQGVGLQIDFREIQEGMPFPLIVPNDFFYVTDVMQYKGFEVDPQLKHQVYIVRTITAGSNSWVRSMMCDVYPGSLVNA